MENNIKCTNCLNIIDIIKLKEDFCNHCGYPMDKALGIHNDILVVLQEEDYISEENYFKHIKEIDTMTYINNILYSKNK